MVRSSSDNSEISLSRSGKFTDITYEHRNLPVHFAMEGGDTLRAAYNADGQRILKETSSGAWQFYVMDGAQTLAVIDQSGLSHMNLFGNALFGRILAMNGALDIANPRRYYLSDHLGSTRAVVDEAGNVLESFDYYPFGLLMPKRSSTTGNTIEKFTGKERDESIGLDYFGARYYDPALARWHSVDPILDELRPDSLFKIRNGIMYSNTPYNYTLNNPVRYLDPNGKCPEPADKDGTICVALFIQSESALGLKGDNRDFSSSSDPSQSRVFLHIDTENQRFSATVNPTCSTGGECTDPVSDKQVDVAFGEDGEITVTVNAVNSRRPLISPEINGTFTFTPDGKGGFKTSGDRDAFPSAEAYLWEGGKAATLFQRPEKTPFHLFPWEINDRWRK